jgi:hypothetical protein
MARIEHVRCDGCGKEWPRVQGGLTMHWERRASLESYVDHGMGAESSESVKAELCDSCAVTFSSIMSDVADWLRGDREALERLRDERARAQEARYLGND